jgi:hypothetical protein
VGEEPTLSLTKSSKITLAIVVIAAVVLLTAKVTTLLWAQPSSSTSSSVTTPPTPTIEFHLQGNHSEDTVSETAWAFGWNVTVFEPLGNGSIFVSAISVGGET